MKIVCKDLKEYTMLVKQCMAGAFSDYCGRCILRNLCGGDDGQECYDISDFLTIEGGESDGDR